MICNFLMNSNFSKIYWFDFNGTVNENLPLTYNTLKICRQEIDKLEINNEKKVGSKKNPIKLNVSFEEKYSSNEETTKIDLNIYEESSLKSISANFNNHIKSYLNLMLQPFNNFLEFKLKLSTVKLNIKHYYVINNKIYVTYKDSLMLFNSHEDYLSNLNEINSVKYNFLYRNYNINNIKLSNILDTLLLNIILYLHLLYIKSTNYNRFDYRLKQTDWGFYINNKTNNLQNIFSGLKYIWRGLRFWIVGLLLGLSAIYYLMYVRLLPFNKIIFAWILVAMFLYWLLSGFVFFVKKYQYSKFTAAIQRFWKRTYIIFWLIEAGTFSVFFYLTLNASSEPVYMYDQIKIYKTHLFSWRWFLIKLLPSVAIILLGYYLQLTLKWNLFNKQNTVILLITLLLLYILWLEFYQFYHILSFFGNINWNFDYDEYIWTLELDTRRTRLANNYIAVCLFAKFWHFVFIFLFWVFFVLRINELGRMRYPLLVANVQNFIIIYIMSWAYMYPWLKFIFRKYLDVPYYWFYLNGRELGIRVFFTDLKLFFYGLTNKFLDASIFNIKFEKYPFYYWISSSPLTNFYQYRKFVIRDSIIYNLNSYIL
uniref:Orf593 n=1 Tax=Tetrahymena pyriformis TaxID=5908 RepID=Q9T7M7_TETPY|nr:orf593 [Tetrahymena pyriformis]AAD41948.1 orf593 [Tetrahymena pyriformis]